MDFSETYKTSRGGAHFSPDGHYLVSAIQNQLILRDSISLNVLQTWKCLDLISSIKWAPNSRLIVTLCPKRGALEVWSVDHFNWRCKISEGSFGLLNAYFAPNSLNILTLSDFYVKLTIWSLCSEKVNCIKRPKAITTEHQLDGDFSDPNRWAAEYFDWSYDGLYLAVAERKQGRDYLNLFSVGNVDDWALVEQFLVETDNLQGLKFAPCGRHAICVWDNPVHYVVLLYLIDGQLLGRFSPYSDALGVRCVRWAPSSQFVAVGSFDDRLRLVNHVTWTEIAQFEHSAVLQDKTNDVVVFEESNSTIAQQNPSTGELQQPFQFLLRTDRPIKLPTLKPAGTDAELKPYPKCGIKECQFSHDGRFMATISDRQPRVLRVYHIISLRLHSVMIFNRPVEQFNWHPTDAKFAAVCATNALYLWTESGVSAVRLPQHSYGQHKDGVTLPLSEPVGLSWSSRGDCLMMKSSQKFAVCYSSS